MSMLWKSVSDRLWILDIETAEHLLVAGMHSIFLFSHAKKRCEA